MKKMNKKTFAIIGMATGALAFLLGILVWAGVFGGDTSLASGSSFYSSGYASFGADFYTYASNNAAEAAAAGRAAAANLDEIAMLIKAFGGISLMLAGLFTCSLFGYKFAEVKEFETAAAQAQVFLANNADMNAPEDAEKSAAEEAQESAAEEVQENAVVENEEPAESSEDA